MLGAEQRLEAKAEPRAEAEAETQTEMETGLLHAHLLEADMIQQLDLPSRE